MIQYVLCTTISKLPLICNSYSFPNDIILYFVIPYFPTTKNPQITSEF